MAEPGRGRRFQFHLSTAVALMFAAGGLIWMNTLPQRGYHAEGWAVNAQLTRFVWNAYGWPYAFTSERELSFRSGGPFLLWRPFLPDAAIAVGVLVVVCVIAETLVTRRGKKGRDA